MAEYLARSLDAADAKALTDHVAACPECQAEFAGLDVLWQALGEIAAPAVHSKRMRERFSAMLAAERASADRRPASRQDRGRWWVPQLWPREPLVQFAVAASLLVVGVVIGRALPLGGPPPAVPANELAAVRGELRDLRQMLTLSLLQQQSATERLRGVNWTSQIEQPDVEIVSALLDTLLHDANVNVRLAAVDALRRFSDRPEVRLGTKQAMGDKSSPLLQVAVIDFMVETRDPQAAALLRAMSLDTSLDEAVRGRAAWGLERSSS